jgi:hypothetical protein
MTNNNPPKIGDVQIDRDKSEWVVIGVSHSGVSRVRRHSLAHQTHSTGVPEIAKSLKVTTKGE